MYKHPFPYDPFQQEAIQKIDEFSSLLVSAPTGAGKTVIAEYAIDHALSLGKNAVYTAPIKALSNQKYRDFKARYGEDKVGILTGDVSMNTQAPILIMTTEIYRNTLFENPARLAETSWVIFDEVHYLDDWERGTVWEEAIMFTPNNIRILALSATIPNLQDIANWMEKIHDLPVAVIEEKHRPVPLHFIYQCQGKFTDDLKVLRRDGYLGIETWRRSRRDRYRHSMDLNALPNKLYPLVKKLREENILPAIYFCFGRRRTELLANDLLEWQFLSTPEQERMNALTDELYERYQLQDEISAQEMLPLIRRGIAYHHAGMLPTLKEVVEQLFTSKLIKFIFTTETFALGINMPARTVIFDELRKFYGTHFDVLRTRDFFQMAGRAGRRGMDTEGSVFIRVNPKDISFSGVQKILFDECEGVNSQFNSTYATILNLYRKYGEELIQIYEKSLHHYQSSKNGRRRARDLMRQKLSLLNSLAYLKRGHLTEKGEFASWMYGYELSLGELHCAGVLEELNSLSLAVLLSGLIYEPRKGVGEPRIDPQFKNLIQKSEKISRVIHKTEIKFNTFPQTKFSHFHLADPLKLWIAGTPFPEIMEKSVADEGELVRYFRMVIQLLRQIRSAPQTSERVKKQCAEVLPLINRGVIDAEKQLRA